MFYRQPSRTLPLFWTFPRRESPAPPPRTAPGTPPSVWASRSRTSSTPPQRAATLPRTPRGAPHRRGTAQGGRGGGYESTGHYMSALRQKKDSLSLPRWHKTHLYNSEKKNASPNLSPQGEPFLFLWVTLYGRCGKCESLPDLTILPHKEPLNWTGFLRGDIEQLEPFRLRMGMELHMWLWWLCRRPGRSRECSNGQCFCRQYRRYEDWSLLVGRLLQ